MKIEGKLPLQGTPADKKPIRFPTKVEGKSFGATFDKAIANTGPKPPEAGIPLASTPITPVAVPSHPMPDLNAAAGPEGPIKKNAISADDAMETIKFRLKSGYYNSKPVTDALTDKLTGFFDELA